MIIGLSIACALVVFPCSYVISCGCAFWVVESGVAGDSAGGFVD